MGSIGSRIGKLESRRKSGRRGWVTPPEVVECLREIENCRAEQEGEPLPYPRDRNEVNYDPQLEAYFEMLERQRLEMEAERERRQRGEIK